MKVFKYLLTLFLMVNPIVRGKLFAQAWPAVAPSGLSYPNGGNPQVVFQGVPITPLVPTLQGTVPFPSPWYSLGSGLPPGIYMDNSNGVVSGAPTTPSNGADLVAFTTATNSSASTLIGAPAFIIQPTPALGSCDHPIVNGSLVTSSTPGQFAIVRNQNGTLLLGSYAVLLRASGAWIWTQYTQQNCPSGAPASVFSKTACLGMYNTSAALSTNLAQCPALEDMLTWEDGAGNRTTYSGDPSPYGAPEGLPAPQFLGGWTAAQRARLDAIYSAIQSGQSNLGLDCPVPSQALYTSRQTLDGNGNAILTENPTQLLFTANQAFDTYAASVAWILYLEINHKVRWSIFDHPSSELVEFFDSSRYHTPFVSDPTQLTDGIAGSALPSYIQPGRDFMNAATRDAVSWEAVCDPRVGYEFLTGANSTTGENLLSGDELSTLAHINNWFSLNVGHGNLLTTDYALNHVYLSDRLTAYTLPGTSVPQVPTSFGCHSAANLFYDLAKSVEIPLLRVVMIQGGATHGALFYGWGNPNRTLFLEHADDAYANQQAIYPTDIVAGEQDFNFVQTFFNTIWLPPSQLQGFTFSGDYSLQSYLSTYGIAGNYPTESQPIMAGSWPADLKASNQYIRAYQGQLCAYQDGENPLGNSCAPGSSTSFSVNGSAFLQDWLNSFDSSTLTVTGGGTASTTDYANYINSCVAAYYGCANINAIYNAVPKVNGTTNSWKGPGGF